MSPPLLFDTRLARARLRRALKAGYAGFLLARAADELEDRLGAVLRDFALLLDVGTPTALAADRLVASARAAKVVRLAAVSEGRGRAATIAGDEEALPFAPGRFDAVVSLLALQGVNDLPGTLAQVRQILKPDGLFVACLLGGATLTELRQALAAAESELEGGVSPRVAPFADLRDYGALLQRAGFALPVADLDTVTVRYAEPLELLGDLRRMGLTNALVARRRVPMRRATLFRAMQIYAERFSDADGRVRATFDLAWLTGWAPHESQQKPLRPGSAKARLADALGVPERSAGEKPGG
jgi:SAM-dependent methyltransferase